MLRAVAFVAAFCALAASAGAQQTEDFGIWVGGFANGRLPPSWNNDQGAWRLRVDVQMRFGDDASQFSQGVLRPGIGYTLGRGWTVWGGYAYIRTDAPYARCRTWNLVARVIMPFVSQPPLVAGGVAVGGISDIATSFSSRHEARAS
jgi:Protein of unknown function (DUF2490)